MAKFKLEIQDLTQAHIDAMFGKLRDEDKREVWASSHMDPDAALQESYNASPRRWALCKDDRPVVAFGVAPILLHKDWASPWMLSTDEIASVQVGFLRRSQIYTGKMMYGYEGLMNFVDERNTTSVRWLRWLGYTIETAEPFGEDRLPFHRFWMRREQCVHLLSA